MGQPTVVASSRLRRLLLRSLLVLCGAMAGTALAWLLSTGTASASQRDLTPLGPPPLPAPVAALADVVGLDVTAADVAGEDVGVTTVKEIAGTSRGDLRPLSEILVRHRKNSPHVEQVKPVVLVEKVQHLTRDAAEELLVRGPSLVLPPTSLSLGGSPQAERVADTRGTGPLVLQVSSVDKTGADQHGDPGGQCRPYRCAPAGHATALAHQVSGQRLGAGPRPTFIPHDLAPRGPVGLIHFPLGPVPASCSGGQGHGDASSGFAESSVVMARAGAAKAPRPMTQWAPLVHGDQPCTTPD